MGVERPVVTDEHVKAASQASDMRIAERCDRILQFLHSRTHSPSDAIKFDPDPAKSPLNDDIATFYELLAHSECITWYALKHLLDHLEEKSLVRKAYSPKPGLYYVLTVPGFERIDELKKIPSNSETAFIAMWFHESMEDAYSKGIEPAVKAAGYKPIRVSDEQFVGPIVDKVFSEIRRSRFVVVDYTHDKEGARGSVYLEAGFAQGLGLDVISTCRKDRLKDVHFDVSHFNHIVWETEEDLRDQLKERITAMLGDGPLIDRKSAATLP